MMKPVAQGGAGAAGVRRGHLTRPRRRGGGWWRLVALFALVAAQAVCVTTAVGPGAAAAADNGAAALSARRLALAEPLARNDFGRPLVIESDEQGRHVGGDVYALLSQPFARLASTLVQRAAWCELLILHLNVKRCDLSLAGIVLYLGPKAERTLASAQRLEFTGFSARVSDGYFKAQLSAPQGPLGTDDYRLVFEAVPDADGSSFVHLRYGFSAGVVGRMAMRVYLMTVGRAKPGFSNVAPPGRPAVKVGGERAAIERNAMRFYLAVEAYLDSLDAPADSRVEQRLQTWFDATERYALQLHEMDREAYLAMKRNEIRRQPEARPAGRPAPLSGRLSEAY